MLNGTITTDRVGGSLVSSRSPFSHPLLRKVGAPREREPAIRARMLRRMGFSPNAVVLRGYEFEEWNGPRLASIN